MKVKPGATIIAGVCQYESLAIYPGLWPTITRLSKVCSLRARIVVLLGFTIWLWLHILLDDPPVVVGAFLKRAFRLR